MSDTLDRFLNLASQIATPFAQRYAYGAQRASEMDAVRERQAWARINGSGPTNVGSAAQSPTSLMDFAFGREIGPDGNPRTNWLRPAMIVGVIVLAVILFRRMAR